MKLLVLGGGGFLEFHMAAEAARAGHTVTTVNRGGKGELEGVEAVAGNRRGDLSALRGRSARMGSCPGSASTTRTAPTR